MQSAQPIQARLTRWFATGLFMALGGGALVWYTVHAWRAPRETHAKAEKATQQKAKGEMVLPALGDLEPLRRALAARRVGNPPSAVPDGPTPAGVPSAGPPVDVLLPSPSQPGGAGVFVARTSAAHRPGAAGPIVRALTGPVFSTGRDSASAGAAAVSGSSAVPMVSGVDEPHTSPGAGDSVKVPSAGLPAAGSSARLPRGSVLDCVLETAIDSTLPGMTTCLLSVDVFGADGRQVVLPRGTQLVGETRGGLKWGQGRLAVLWQSARRPDGVTVELESPGTDALGRAGVAGSVDRQFGERFGAAVLLSVIDGAIAAGVASQQRSGSSVVVAPSGSEAVMTEMLKETQGIQPKLLVPQGARIAVLVARDIDFGSVLPRSR